jgi:hypothetical protein
MCSIEGCDGKTALKGLCAKHYMRVRRTGDPSKTWLPGPPRKAGLTAFLRSQFSDLSPNTQNRHIRAYKVLAAFGGQEALEAAILKASRANGPVNVAAMLRQADLALSMALKTWPKEQLAEARDKLKHL